MPLPRILHSTRSVLREHGLQGLSLLFRYYALSGFARVGPIAVQCPCCAWTGPRFRPILVMPQYVRPNAQCPGCLSLERHRALNFLYTELLADLPPGKPVIHYAPEACFEAPMRQRFGDRYLPVFYTDDDLPVATRNAGQRIAGQHFTLPDGTRLESRGDLESMEWASDSLAAILHNHVLEHVPDEAKAIREHFRVLAPGGKCLITVPLHPDLSATRFFPEPDVFGHWRDHALDLRDRFVAAGFSAYWHDLAADPALARRHGFLAGEKLLVCTKPS